MLRPTEPAATVPRHQHLIVTVFGLYRDVRGAIPIAALIRMLGELGVEAAGVRSSVSRLKKRGILFSTTVGGAAAYALAPELTEVFAEGDRRIFSRHANAAGRADDWLLATFTVPESQRHLRHRIRTVLGRWGFGAVAPGLWIAPTGVTEAVRTRLARDGLDGYVEFFSARYLDDDRLREKVARWWDLDRLEAQYRAFVDRHAEQDGAEQDDAEQEDADGPAAGTPREAFGRYVPLVTEWRQLPYLDPGLPRDLLPDGWHGRIAEGLFVRLHQRWSATARQYAESLLFGD